MTIADAIRRAVAERSPAGAARIADIMRFEFGLDYAQSFRIVRSACPEVTSAEWDGLLYDADNQGD